MNKFLNYISIAVVVFTLFSCNKNEWTPDKEAEFKKDMKKGLLAQGKGLFSDEQAAHVADCVFEKIKSKDLKPNDAKKPETVIQVQQMGKECAQEALSKTKNGTDNSWNPEIEKTYKAILKNTFIQSGVESSKATLLADCAIAKMKEQNIGPADLQNPKNSDIVQKIGKTCGEELLKKK